MVGHYQKVNVCLMFVLALFAATGTDPPYSSTALLFLLLSTLKATCIVVLQSTQGPFALVQHFLNTPNNVLSTPVYQLTTTIVR